MRKIHKATSLAVVLNIGAVVFLFQAYPLIAALLSLFSFFAAIKELSVYTSIYQFGVIVFSALLLGLSIDLPNQHFPLTSVALLLLAALAVLRIAFFRFFSYTSYSWLESSLLFVSFVIYLISNLFYNHDWRAYVLPAPLFIFCAVFAWGTIRDKKQLLKNSGGGYKVQIGKEADEFQLPDQNGVLTKLSDYKNKRHVLLIFVRGDWCPGCHMMLRTYEKNNEKFKAKDVFVMAIGPDPVGVNRQMVEKLGVDFKVLSDEKQRTAMVYGVQLKDYENPFSETYEEGIPLPASFLIDKNGVLRYVSRPDKVGEFLNPSLIFPILEKLDEKKSILFKPEIKIFTKPEKEVSSSESSEEHKDIIDSLKKELNKYESIIDQANDAIIVIDIVDGKIHQSNPSIAKLLGYTKQELESFSLFDLHPAEYLEKSSRLVADVWEQGGLIYSDIPFITKSKEIIPVECSAKVAPFAGRPAIVIYARDIRERIRLEKEIQEQRKLIDEKSKDISDSIEYSKRIQRSVFMEQEKLKDQAPDSFILFKPRDVVSGDFYWFTNYEIRNGRKSSNSDKHVVSSNVLVLAAVDCTGHGVPGAFMSIIANTLLNQTLVNSEISTPAEALDYVNAELKKSLNKNKEDSPLRDGMDIALCSIDTAAMQMEYAGANNPVYLIRQGEIIIINADKQPITASTDSAFKPFTNQIIPLQKGDAIYLFTDGYADQFGGEKEKKFMYKKFKEVLLGMQDKSMNEQRQELELIFENWKGNLEQVDDVLVIGIRI